MIRRKKLGIVALVLVLTNNVWSQETCSHQCKMPRGTQRLSYKEQTTYSYKFSSKLNLILPNTQDVKANTQVRTTALLTPQNGCAFVLQLRNFKIIGANEKTYEHIVGIEKPVTFQYLDGAVGADVCSEPNDPSQSLNVKRAIISFFQLDSYGRQTDVFGVCPTGSVVEDDKGDKVVHRTRDLNSCERREHLQQNFILEWAPILNGNFVSVQRLTGGILKHAHILEKYESMNNGVNASVQSVLEYVGTVEEMKPKLRSIQTKSIIFDPIPTPLHKSTTNVIMGLIQKFSEDELGVSATTARRFLSLIKIMRESTKEDLISVYKLIENSYSRKIMLDALTRCGTSEALMTAFELELGNELQRNEKGFAYIRYPTRKVVQAAADLLMNNRLSKEAYPGIGKLVRRYCEQHKCPDDVIIKITKSFVSKLETETLYALKALSNAKYLPEDVAHQVLAFVRDPHKDVRVRSAAFDVLACTSKLHDDLLDVLQNTEEDSEIRIKSYLILAKCPNRHVAETIELVVNNEPSIQVGGFIASHVKSLNNILSTIYIQKTFPRDTRKYSFTSEAQHKFGEFTGKIKTDVIYSQKSFLPRVVKVNVLGSDVGVLEIELRQENFDRVLERLMGPVGTFKKEVAEWPSDVDLNLEVGVKLFGSDFLFLSVSENSRRFVDSLFGSIGKEVNFELDKQNGVVFLDWQLSYPTSMGFPLRLSVEGVSSVQVLVHYKSGLSPSVDLDVTVGISLDAVVIESGVKVITKLHVAAGVVVDALEDETKILLPLQQQEASVSHDIFFNQREFGEPETLKQVRFPMNDVVTECVQGFSDYTGLDLCLELNASPEYLAGSYRAALVLKNTDFSHLSLTMRSIAKQNKTQLSAKFLGRRQNTKAGATVDFSTEEGIMARVSAALPKQNVSAELRYTNTKTETSLFADLRLNHKKFFAKLGVGIDRIHQKNTYSPLVYVAIPGKFDRQAYLVNTKGSLVVHRKGRSFKVDLEDLQLMVQLEPNAKIYSAGGNFGQNKDGYFSDVTISDGRTVINNINKLRWDRNKVKIGVRLTNNRCPWLNLHVDYGFVKKVTNISSLLEVVHGADPKSKVNRLTVKNEAQLGHNGRIDRVRNRVTYPAGEFLVVANFERTNKSVTLDAAFKAGAKLNSTFELNFSEGISDTASYGVKIDGTDDIAATRLFGGVQANFKLMVSKLEPWTMTSALVCQLHEDDKGNVTASFTNNNSHVLKANCTLNATIGRLRHRPTNFTSDIALLDLCLFNDRNATAEVMFDGRFKYGLGAIRNPNGVELYLSTPLRRIVLDVSHNTTGSLSLNFYPNKLRDLHKTSLNVNFDQRVRNKTRFEARLIDPNLSKDLVFLYVLERHPNKLYQCVVLDIFQRDENKIVLANQLLQEERIILEIKSKGLEFLCRCVVQKHPEYVYDSKIQLGKKKYFSSLVIKSIANEVVLNLTALNNKVVTVKARRSGVPLKMLVTGHLELVGVAPLQVRLTNNFASFNIAAGFKDNFPTDNIFRLQVKVFGEDVASALATKNNTVLVLACLSTNDSRLLFDYRYNASRVHGLVLKPAKVAINQRWNVFLSQTTIFEDIYRVQSRIRDAAPNFTRFLDFYLENIEDELLNEAAFRSLNHLFLENTYNYTNRLITSYLYGDIGLTRKLEDVMYEALLNLNQCLGDHEKAIREFGEDFFRNFDKTLVLINVIKNGLLEAYKVTEVPMKLAELIRFYNRLIMEIRSNTNSVVMTKFSDYTEKKLKKEYVDDEIALKEIAAALEDVLIYVYDSISCKTLYLLMTNELKTIALEELGTLKFPQDFTGTIAQNHIFTFDGEHTTVNANCSLVLLEDVFDGNFSIIANYQGSIVSITFTDRQSKVVVDAVGSFNQTGSISVTEGYDYILIESVYGLQLRCSSMLITCVVKVSGYYHAHLKGLLGYANHERYDDFTLPNGKIVFGEVDFVKAYADEQCEQVEVITNVSNDPRCTQLFSEFDFRYCSRFVDPGPFIAACDEGLQMHVANTRDYVLHAYAVSCSDHLVHIKLDQFNVDTNLFLA